MVGAIIAGLGGVLAGWGLAIGNPALAVLAAAVAVIGIFLDRARLADHRAAAAIPVASSQTGWEDVHRELARARRHERPMAIVRLSGDPARAAGDRAASIVPYLRRIDRVWAEHGDVNLLLPDTDRTAAERLVSRLQTREPAAVGASPSIATFPVDGLTSGALLAALYGTPLPAVPVPVGVGRPVELPADVIELRPRLAADAPLNLAPGSTADGSS
jgi:hypothetical protein